MNLIMRKLGIGASIILIGVLAVTGVALAAQVYSLFGDATIVGEGNPGHAVELKSIAPSGYGGITFTGTGVTTFSSLTTISADYEFTQNSCGGGAPRFQISLTNGTDSGSIYAYLGPAPDYTDCQMNVWTNTGNLAAPLNDVDTSQLPGGSFYDPYADAQAKYGSYTVTGIQLITDSGWFFNGTQTVLIDNVAINNNTFTFEPNVPTSIDQCKNDGWQSLQERNFHPFKNLGQCVSYVEKLNQ